MNRELAESWIACHGRPEEIGQLTSLLDFVKAQRTREIVGWLKKQSEVLRTAYGMDNVGSIYLDEMARRLSDGECP